MDGVLVNNKINASIDNANRIGNVHQYFIKSLLIIITITLSPMLLVFCLYYLVRVSGQFLQQIVGCSRWIDAYPVLG